MKRFVTWSCPGCGQRVKARGAKEILHQCVRRQWRLTVFVPVVEPKNTKAAS